VPGTTRFSANHAVGLAHVGEPSGGARQRREAAAERIDVLAEPRRRIAFRVHRDEKRLESAWRRPEAASDLGEPARHGADVWQKVLAKRDGQRRGSAARSGEGPCRLVS